MTTTTLRAQLESTGEFVGAIRRLGETYSADEYLTAVQAARDAGDGERYADAVLGVDADSLLRGVDEAGDDVVRAAEANLRRRGIDPDKATYLEFADALVQVTP